MYPSLIVYTNSTLCDFHTIIMSLELTMNWYWSEKNIGGEQILCVVKLSNSRECPLSTTISRPTKNIACRHLHSYTTFIMKSLNASGLINFQLIITSSHMIVRKWFMSRHHLLCWGDIRNTWLQLSLRHTHIQPQWLCMQLVSIEVCTHQFLKIVNQ